MNGTLVSPQSKRTADNQCGSCNEGYALESNKKCRPYGGKCAHGNLVHPQSKRKADDQCGTCDPGYVLPRGVSHCRPYGGTCTNGHLISQSKRTADDHCGSCKDGYALRSNSCEVCAAGTYSKSGKECEPCPNCRWSAQGASECNTCDYVLHAIDTGNYSDCDLLPSQHRTCAFNPFIHLARKTDLVGWPKAVHWLRDNGFDVDMEDPSGQDRTPVVAAVEHCTENSFQRRHMMQFLVIQFEADTITGLPLVKAETGGCNEKWRVFLATHRQGLSPEEKWDRLSSSSSCYTSVAIGFSGGLVGGIFLHLYRSIGTPEDRSRGALRLAAMLLYPPCKYYFHMFMCHLAVIANIMWMFHICMATVQQWQFLSMYAGFVLIPAFCTQCVQSSRKFLDRPAFVALPLVYDLQGSKTALGFHIFTVVRFFLFRSLPLMLVENKDTRLYRNPSHLPRHVGLPVNIDLPLRWIFYTFGSVMEFLSFLWCAMTLGTVLWHYRKRRCIDNQGLLSTDETTESENNIIKELASRIEQAANEGDIGDLDIGDLTVEREVQEGLPSWLNRWPRSYHILSQASGDHVKRVKRAGTCGLIFDLLFMKVDIITDLLQIRNMYLDEFYILGGALLLVFVSSLTAQVLGKDWCTECQEFMDSSRQGFRTNNFLRMLDREKGFEASMSLAISCYAVYWQVNPDSCIMSLVSIIFSGWGVASYLFCNVFLEHAADHKEQGWRLPDLAAA